MENHENDYVDQKHNERDWDIWRHRYDEFLETREDAYKAIQTMVAGLGDRYTHFLDRRAFEEEKESLKLNSQVLVSRLVWINHSE